MFLGVVLLVNFHRRRVDGRSSFLGEEMHFVDGIVSKIIECFQLQRLSTFLVSHCRRESVIHCDQVSRLSFETNDMTVGEKKNFLSFFRMY